MPPESARRADVRFIQRLLEEDIEGDVRAGHAPSIVSSAFCCNELRKFVAFAATGVNALAFGGTFP